jgi:hypothetical protein
MEATENTTEQAKPIVSLAKIIEKNSDRLVDQAATSIKVMYSFAFADVSQDELRERLYEVMEALVEITKKGETDPALVREIADNVMVGKLYEGFDNRSITEEVLQIVDMVINKQIDAQLSKPEQADDKAASKQLLAEAMRSTKDITNARSRHQMEEKIEKKAKKAAKRK